MSSATFDEALGALATRPRRRILVELLDDESYVPEDDDQRGLGMGRVRSQIRLYHTHLPKLDAAGFVEWDRETGAVHRGPRFDDVRPLLELMDRHADELPDGWV